MEGTWQWTQAKLWLERFRGAGFSLTANDKGEVFVNDSAAFIEKFKGDNPQGIIEMLRAEIVGLIRKGNAAPAGDPRLQIEAYSPDQIAYMAYTARRIEAEEQRANRCERATHGWANEKPATEQRAEELRQELAHVKKCHAEALANVARLTKDRDEWKRKAGTVPQQKKGAA